MKCKLLIIPLIFILSLITVIAETNVTISNIIDTFEFDTTNGETPTSLVVSQNALSTIVATFYDGVTGDGFVTTFEILNNGSIIQPAIDLFEFDTTSGLVPTALKISNNTYAVIYKGPLGDGFAKTIEILNNGTIIGTIETLEVEDTDLEHPNLFFIQEQRNLIGVTSSQTTVNGVLGIGFVLDNGTINRTDRFVFNDTQANRADSTNVTNNIILIAYQADIGGDNFGGAIETIQILDNGSVDFTIDYEILDAGEGDSPSIARVDDDTFAIFYEATGTFGIVKTYNISSTGQISANLSSFTYDATSGMFPNAIPLGGGTNIFLNVYEDGATQGELTAIEISDLGIVNKTIRANLTYENTLSQWQEIINIRDDIFLITYQGVALDGFVKTVNISAEVLVAPPVLNDTTAPTITFISPANNTLTNIIPLNITFSVTDDSTNDITCTLTNSTFQFDEGTFVQSINSNLTLAEGEIALAQSFPSLDITCFDNTVPNNNSAILNLNYTLDTNPPIIFLIRPINNQRFNRDIVSSINIKANCTDSPVFRLNITIENSSDRIASFESRTPVNNFIVIDEQLDITTLGIGNYSVNHTCADPSTSELISDYNIRKNTSDKAIRFVTDKQNVFTIRYLQNSMEMETFGTTKNVDRYNFWFHGNQSETIGKRTFIFEVITKKPIYYLPNSKHRGHFVTGDNWITFDLNDPKAEYIITKNNEDNWEIEITTTRTQLNFNSVGDLNIATITTQFEIFFVAQITDLFDVRECRTDTGSVLLLGLFVVISLFLITLGITSRVGFIGFFGAIILMITSWYIAPCLAIIAFVLALLSFVFIIWFVVGSIGFRNDTFT